MYRPVDADVIIVGGGLAGLTAAYWLFLKEPTLDVFILERNERIGGRIFSTPLLVDRDKRVSYFDLGAQWVCKKQNHLFHLLDTLGISHESTSKRGKIIAHYHSAHICGNSAKNDFNFLSITDKIQFIKFIVKVESLCHELKNDESSKYVDILKNQTLEQFVKEKVSSDALFAVIDHMVLVSCGLHSRQISALFYIFFCISTKGICHQLSTEGETLIDLRIEGGAQTICDKLVENIGRDSIVTKNRVKSISVRDRYVEVVSQHATYCCSAVIVAVPPKEVLNIAFSPNLHEKHFDAINKTCTNTVTNFVATFDRNFWANLQLSGECYFFDKSRSKGPIDYCTDISSPTKTALTGRIFQGRPTNDKFPIYRSDILTQLAQYFGTEALHPIDYCEKSWSNTSCQMVGWEIGNNYIKDICHPYERLFFAGAETTTEWYGYLGGAVHSGMRAALEALYLIRPGAMKASDLDIIRPSKRRELAPLRNYYGEPVHAVVEHWKLIISVCLVVLVALWRLKRKFFS